ncbi:hypothetical protein Ddye_022843 [Dipteronia dyeriana]|uniref:RNase H type-1 domain-containing protein n=1 Tax=Dipteronia dyeriana TaxID=168575 RepID=A0AAD9TSR8_9ROSI|nr:hypothetical protein Ddye_022843 [Dipteronia dyeriana]
MSLGDVELFCVVIWRIWFGRNYVIHGQCDLIWKDVINWNEDFLNDFYKADSSLQYKPNFKVNKPTCKWMSPNEGKYKANCDTTVDRINGKVGFGIVIRNNRGDVMAYCVQSMVANFSIKTAKLVDVWKSIIFSGDRDLTPCSFELDETCIVIWIKNGGHGDSVNEIILHDIDSLVNNLGEVDLFTLTDRTTGWLRVSPSLPLNVLMILFGWKTSLVVLKKTLEADMPN